MIWDGNCGFCKYWVVRWKQMTGSSVVYKPYQEILRHIPDIPEWACKEAARLAGTDGIIYNGPEAAYKALALTGRWRLLYKIYVRYYLFRHISDHAYMWVSKNRNFFFILTKVLWGSDPARPAHYWLYYLLAFALLVVILAGVLAVS